LGTGVCLARDLAWVIGRLIDLGHVARVNPSSTPTTYYHIVGVNSPDDECASLIGAIQHHVRWPGPTCCKRRVALPAGRRPRPTRARYLLGLHARPRELGKLSADRHVRFQRRRGPSAHNRNSNETKRGPYEHIK
jgi:hypothetical protein